MCPHCKATVLESAAVCPGCRHHLRFGGAGQTLEPGEGYCALSVDGTIAHTKSSEPCEYCVVLDVRDDRGEQLTRQVVGVGVLQSGERRRLNLSVEMLPVRVPVAVKAQAPLKPPGVVAAAPAKPAASSNPNGPQQPATPITSPAAAASMRGLGVIRKPR
jgi:hypothetical protein